VGGAEIWGRGKLVVGADGRTKDDAQYRFAKEKKKTYEGRKRICQQGGWGE